MKQWEFHGVKKIAWLTLMILLFTLFSACASLGNLFSPNCISVFRQWIMQVLPYSGSTRSSKDISKIHISLSTQSFGVVIADAFLQTCCGFNDIIIPMITSLVALALLLLSC
jgi:hypothetical protein